MLVWPQRADGPLLWRLICSLAGIRRSNFSKIKSKQTHFTTRADKFFAETLQCYVVPGGIRPAKSFPSRPGHVPIDAPGNTLPDVCSQGERIYLTDPVIGTPPPPRANAAMT